MNEKSPIEILDEVKEAIEFQLMVTVATGNMSISLNKDHAYVCLIAIEQLKQKKMKGGAE